MLIQLRTAIFVLMLCVTGSGNALSLPPPSGCPNNQVIAYVGFDPLPSARSFYRIEFYSDGSGNLAVIDQDGDEQLYRIRRSICFRDSVELVFEPRRQGSTSPPVVRGVIRGDGRSSQFDLHMYMPLPRVASLVHEGFFVAKDDHPRRLLSATRRMIWGDSITDR